MTAQKKITPLLSAIHQHLNNMRPSRLFCLLILTLIQFSLHAQNRVGINTTSPVRPLEIYGSGTQYLRVTSTPSSGTRVGLELVRGEDNVANRDWKVENWNGHLRFSTGTDNFASLGDEAMRFSESGNMGVGGVNPVARLQVVNGEDASNTLDGFMLIGSKTSNNLILDPNEIMARLNGAPSTLYIQTGGGNTWFGSGNVLMGSGGGGLGIGGATMSGRVNVNGSSYQVQLRNPSDGLNDWYIGASHAGWLTTDDLLCFSPTTGYLNSTLRLKRITENNGSEAPVMISSPSTQTLYLDGNEIDSETALYINHNSNEETYLNPNGGKVGVGTASPDGKLTVKTTEAGLGLQRDFGTWWIDPTSTGVVNFFKNTTLLAYFSYDNGGDWVALSDARMKENISPLTPVMDRVMQLNLYIYSFKHDPAHKRDIGVLAQETLPLFPEVVSYADDQYGVCYDQLTVIAIKGIQEQQDRIEKLLTRADEFLSMRK